MQAKWWHPEQFNRKKANLLLRMAMIKAIRAYFDAQNFYEVETPILQVCPVMDAHIHAFKTLQKGPDLKVKSTPYLHTSPEFAMKKLMVAGVEKLYQICHVFRNAENSKLHSAEFTMIEWYRTPGDYTDMMEDCVKLLRACAKAADITTYRYKGHKCDPFREWERLSVVDAFDKYAGIDLSTYLDDSGQFRQAVKDLGLHTADDDAWDDLFFRVMDAKIEPHLGMGRPTILYDYPACMASLSRKKPDDPRFAERFELYVCGIELANGFSELTDAREQAKRFTEEMDYKEKLYGERYPIDEEFIEALEYGLPESGGIALGIDRLIMLATGAEDINDVLWCEKV
ncbi:MAG: EF-P lysine aminoacylase EpmA [Alphaproteobacteria bacterium]|nr:EF-P lysine aminoacylase EpmA [Alphaproteobacteria bacterium]